MAVGSSLGLITSTVWHLEMFGPPKGPSLQPPNDLLEIVRVKEPTIRFYRFLYDNVGGDWFWCSRRRMSDRVLGEAIFKDSVDIRVLWHGGAPAGFAEIDFRSPDDVELVYFGLMPEAIGKSCGRYLLDWTIRHAFSLGASRFWVHTCDLDHPRARSVYESCGFELFDMEHIEETVLLDMPKPAHVGNRLIKPLP